MTKQPHDKKYNICGAKTRKGTPCLRPAGWGTDHQGEGKCKLHGGKSTGPPKKNKNAVTTGEHENIWLDTLDEDEKELLDKITLDKLKQIDNEIKLTEIRERRMLLRIQKLSKSTLTPVSVKTGIERGQETNIKEAESSLIQIQSIEEALTRVQTHKARLINIKHKLELDLGLSIEEQKARINKIKAETTKLEADGTTQSPPVINIVDAWSDNNE